MAQILIEFVSLSRLSEHEVLGKALTHDVLHFLEREALVSVLIRQQHEEIHFVGQNVALQQ